MDNIYEIIKEQEKIFDREYNEIQESCKEWVIIEKSTVNTLEQLVYNNPEKKKLSVLIEEAEAADATKTNNIIDKLKEQMKKVLNWIMNMFKHYEKLFAEGANFVKNNDLNQCMNKIKANHLLVNVTWHSQKPPFQRMQTECLRNINIDKMTLKSTGVGQQTFTNVNKSNAMGAAANTEIKSGDKTETYLNSLIKKFKLDKENLNETKITDINVLVIHNDLVTLPEANKKLNNIKSKVQKLYNQAINYAREDARTTSDNKAAKANNKLSMINAQVKALNEQIRAYAKLMTMVFKEDYNIAKLIVAKANGQTSDSIANAYKEPKKKR